MELVLPLSEKNIMSKTLTSILTLFVVAAFVSPSVADIWNGPAIEFVRLAGVDGSLPENQDMITPNVVIARGNTQGIFNSAQESFYSMFSSPSDTEWATGTTADLGLLTFTDWQTWANSNGGPPETIGIDAVLHLISDDIYIDIQFTAWTQGPGGGFAYLRSTPGAVPEPSSCLAVLMLGGLFSLRRRR